MTNEFLKLYSETNVGNKRPANEDFLGYSETPNGLLYIVCDGMGGHVGGATASQLAVKSIIDFFSEKTYENIYVALSEAIIFANQEILKKAANEPELKGMGTTCTVLIAREPEIFIAHVGDSRIYLHRQEKLYRLTKDHSFVQDLVDQGLITDDDAENHPRKNQILKALGITQNLEPTVHSAPIHPTKGDKFLMCSDGLNGEINDEKINEILNSSKDINNVGSKLVQSALDAGGKDNITLEIIEVLSSPFDESIFPNYNPFSHVKTDPNNNDLKTTIINDVSSKDFKSQNNILKVVLALAVMVIIIGGGLMISFSGHNEINVDNSQKVDETVPDKREAEIIDEEIEQIEQINSIEKTEKLEIDNENSKSDKVNVETSESDTASRDSSFEAKNSIKNIKEKIDLKPEKKKLKKKNEEKNKKKKKEKDVKKNSNEIQPKTSITPSSQNSTLTDSTNIIKKETVEAEIQNSLDTSSSNIEKPSSGTSSPKVDSVNNSERN